MKKNRRTIILILLIVGIVFIANNSCKKDEVPAPLPIPELTTASITNITSITADCGGTITTDGGTAVIARGVCWSIGQTPKITDSITKDGAGGGSFASNITGLKANSTYFVRAYATNGNGTGYGMSFSFTTKQAIIPKLTTDTVKNISQTSVSCGGTITQDYGSVITERGVCWSTSPTTTISDSKTSDGTGIGNFKSSVTGLSAYTKYYIRAYANNSAGTGYGNITTFTTQQDYTTLPVLSTTPVTNITKTTATSGGTLTSIGGTAVIARGVCLSLGQTPTISDIKTSDGSGGGSFTSSIIGLTSNTNYYMRAYATNSAGTAYGNTLSFTTQSPTLPVLTTQVINNITPTTAKSGGIITNDGSAAITDRGVCYSTTSYPTIVNNKTSDGSGVGSFTSAISGLNTNTTYYLRAYATNSAGTSYGNQVLFKTYTDSVTDIDGNVYYAITIGTQVWLVENLRVTHYRNGNPIPNITDGTQWSKLTTDAYCDYDNWSTIYGRLYNWYAVNDSRNIAPTGWHVSTDAEWTILTTFLGGVSVAGGKLKEKGTTHWSTPNTAATNESGFTALPGGNRASDGLFYGTSVKLIRI